jgi:hypothetical protein
MDRSKSPVSRGALERVLARAAELQAASGDDSEPSDALTEEQILDLGREVGLSPENLRQALAEERAQIQPLMPSAAGFGDQLFGVARVAAQRVVRGKPERVLAVLDRWMQREEWLRVVRQRADRIVWEPRRGLVASLRRVFSTRDNALYRANDIAATVVPMDREFTVVRLEADFAVLRRAMAGQTAVATVVGASATGAAVLMSIMLPVAFLPVVGISAAAYIASRRTHQHALQRAMLTLELVLDRLERGESEPPSLMRLIEAALPPSR